MQALKQLQHAIVEDFDEYKRLSPRELGPGSYNVGLTPAIVIKEPEKPSYCFITSSDRAPAELQSSHLNGMRPRFTLKEFARTPSMWFWFTKDWDDFDVPLLKD